MQPPSGTVTFLFTDIEGSTRLWEEHPDEMRTALAEHDARFRSVINANRGYVVKTTGDGFHAAFGEAADAVAAAQQCQVAIADLALLKVRIGISAGEAQARDGDYFGPAVNAAARLMSVAHGGQIVCSRPVSELVRERFTLVDLGEHRLRDLQAPVHVFQVDTPGLNSEFPPLRSLGAQRGNLPRQMTTFVGREAELASLAELVRTAPLVILTGTGGVGKTRLALQVAAEAVTDFPDGAWLCELASITDPGAVWDALAGCLRVQAFPGRTLEESVLEYLAAKRLLVVLDNCEHLLEAAARLVSTITQRCALVSVLVTSQEGLAIAGERIVAVPPLEVPRDDADLRALMGADAVRLFSDRALVVKSDFVLTDHNASAVAGLCRRLDGIPLAIELAAARVRSLPPEELVARLDQRFNLLTRGSRVVLERHQTLRGAIDWSYDLLDPAERRALDRLSVFAGSCDLAAAEWVLANDALDASAVIDGLGHLVDKSLVVVDDEAGGVRYRLLESIREYARERLDASGDAGAVRRGHADYYVGVAEAAGPHLRSRRQVEWAHRVAHDIENFRAALDWAVETSSPDHALRLVAPFTVRGMAIGDAAKDWSETASTMPGSEDLPLFPVVAAFASLAATFAGDFDRAEARVGAAEAAQSNLGTRLIPVVRARAMLSYYRGDLERAREHTDDWVELARTSGDTRELVNGLTMQASIGMDDPEGAIATLDEVVRLARDAGFASVLSMGLPMLARLLPIEDSQRALSLLDEAIEIGDEIGDRIGVMAATGTKGAIAARRGEWRTALQTALETVEQHVDIGDLANLYQSLLFAGVACAELGLPDDAVVLIGWADASSDRQTVTDWLLAMLATTHAAAVEALGTERVAELAARGAAFDSAEVVAYLRVAAEPLLGI